MTKEDLIKAFGSNSNDFSVHFKEQVQKALIVNIYLNNGDMIKIGDGSLDRLKISAISNISDTFFTITYDSHQTTDILFTSISRIEYFY